MPQRYFVDEINHQITGQDAHHILHVMRMKTGDEIIVCSDKTCFLVSIKIDQQLVTYDMIKQLPNNEMTQITIIQGLPKGNKTEFIVKYATIFGASHIFFTEMNRSIAKIDNEDHKIKRLKAIAKEASELAHRDHLPEISMIKNIMNIDFKTYHKVLLADENCKDRYLHDVCKDISFKDKIAIIIGPEGGISDKERVELLSKGVTPISLGELIFPTEAACLYVLSYFSLKKSENF